MIILVCIDDTDNLESRGTGKLASLLAADLERNCWGKSSFITRHQLFVHPDVPYTSHNSSMCFSAELDYPNVDRFIAHSSEFLEKESAQGADPGLCVVVVDKLVSPEPIIDFGLRAKREVLAKRDAYDLACRHEIYLSEHGGTGDGVIGALAGVGLRLSGNDGRLRGKLEIGCENSAVSVRIIRSHPHAPTVRSLCGKTLEDHELVKLGDKVKAVFLDGKPVLLVSAVAPAVDGARWRTCSKQDLMSY
ncbi:MAG: hypothetical protein ACLP2U_12175 [Syntrophobacteraceae bacterium]